MPILLTPPDDEVGIGIPNYGIIYKGLLFYNVMAHLPFIRLCLLWLCLLVNLSYVFIWLCLHKIYISSFGLIIFTISTNLNPFSLFYQPMKNSNFQTRESLFTFFVLLPVSHCWTITALTWTQLLRLSVVLYATCSSVLSYFHWVSLYVLSLAFVLLLRVLSKGQLLSIAPLFL
jgi:hypothetical protein